MTAPPKHAPISPPLALHALDQLLGQARRLARYSLTGRHPSHGRNPLRDPDHFSQQHMQPARLDAGPAPTGGMPHV